MKVMTNPAISRRTVLAGAAAAGVTSALVACGDDTPATSGSGNSQATSSPATVKAGDVPVGGGTVVADQQVVVTQPAEGTYKAFSAVCTHQGCLVTKVENSTITCSCHNSTFSAADGSVMSGPANRALAARTVSVNGDTLTVT
jgi:Rieske Fe-S protein